MTLNSWSCCLHLAGTRRADLMSVPQLFLFSHSSSHFQSFAPDLFSLLLIVFIFSLSFFPLREKGFICNKFLLIEALVSQFRTLYIGFLTERLMNKDYILKWGMSDTSSLTFILEKLHPDFWVRSVGTSEMRLLGKCCDVLLHWLLAPRYITHGSLFPVMNVRP